MAEIKLKGFVEKQLGTKGVKVVESHRAKDESGNWVTKGKTFYTVWVGDLALPNVGDAVIVSGRMKTVMEEYNGEKRYSLHVSAHEILREPTRDDFIPKKSTTELGNEPFVPSSWISDEDAPF